MDKPLLDLGWANGWPRGEMPEIVRACSDTRRAGEAHDVREGPHPAGWSCCYVVQCHTCGYEYVYDSGD